ncbi:MAG: DUF2905 domain-containing protein [Candidatus Omnitrophica bacterium]|nr:DUF2905 domain-containing protein [Candidatus Omnitrophota bacterium]
MQEIAKTLIIIGGVLITFGIVLFFIPKIPFLGRLPGDIYVQRKNFTFYFPLATSLLVSLLLSLAWRLFSRR